MNAFTATKHGHSRFWAVHDSAGELVCFCVYKRGAVEAARRLQPAPVSALELKESVRPAAPRPQISPPRQDGPFRIFRGQPAKGLETQSVGLAVSHGVH